MIEGITVLNKELIMTTPSVLTVIALVSVIIGIVSFCVVINSHNNIVSIIGSILFVLSIVGFSLGLIIEEPTDRYKYECTIDESVSIQDIYDRYEVVEQRGEIWVLEDKIKED